MSDEARTAFGIVSVMLLVVLVGVLSWMVCRRRRPSAPPLDIDLSDEAVSRRWPPSERNGTMRRRCTDFAELDAMDGGQYL